jgi:hydrogenase-4 component F
MIISGLLLIPLILAVILFILKNDRFAGWLLFIGALCQAVLCGLLTCYPEPLTISGSLQLAADRTGFLILAVTSLLFLLTSMHICFWLPVDGRKSGTHCGMKKNTFAAVLLLFLLAMTLTALAQDFGMLWVAVEATTLASAPLIIFHKGKGSLEAMWKYLLICSVGIGLALLGTMLLAASLQTDGNSVLSFSAVQELFASGRFETAWFKAGYVFCFAGYALKMGLAPFHTWLPDAHSEAPAPVSALLSGSLLNCALLAIIRLLETMPPELSGFCLGYLKFAGFFSLAVAAFFIIRQKDFKRMLAYSSVEHMGLIALLAGYGMMEYAMLHLVAHSLIKMSLFLLAGNILLGYGTRSAAAVRGLSKRLPNNAGLWITGILLICGTPPSPLFFSELALIRSCGIPAAAVILLLLLTVFCGMSHAALNMFTGGEPTEKTDDDREIDRLIKAPAAALALVIALGTAVGMAWLTMAE